MNRKNLKFLAMLFFVWAIGFLAWALIHDYILTADAWIRQNPDPLDPLRLSSLHPAYFLAIGSGALSFLFGVVLFITAPSKHY